MSLGLLTAVALALVMATGCSQTVESKPAVVEQMQSGNVSPAISGFFGSSYTLLQPGQAGQAAMVYVNPSAQWSQYNKIMLEPVEFWDSPTPLSHHPISIC
jgi:hypothetical protein